MNSIARICVFCGSRPGDRPEYLEAARTLGAELGRRRIGLVYGGASVGVMGVLADAALAAGGEVFGVIPGGLAAREIAHANLTELTVVHTMHERKARMERLSDGFIALPGGFGTFEELFEMVTWIQLGLHRKPAGVLNVSGYYDALLAQVERGLSDGLIPQSLRHALIAEPEPIRLLDRLIAHEVPPASVRWITRDET